MFACLTCSGSSSAFSPSSLVCASSSSVVSWSVASSPSWLLSSLEGSSTDPAGKEEREKGKEKRREKKEEEQEEEEREKGKKKRREKGKEEEEERRLRSTKNGRKEKRDEREGKEEISLMLTILTQRVSIIHTKYSQLPSHNKQLLFQSSSWCDYLLLLSRQMVLTLGMYLD